jgi:hypothetical protein
MCEEPGAYSKGAAKELNGATAGFARPAAMQYVQLRLRHKNVFFQ